MLLISSEAPFVQALKIGLNSRRVATSPKRLLLGRMKYTRGISPPTHWLIPVARAAPATPMSKTAIKRASNVMLVSPAATVQTSPIFGLSAATRKL